MSAGSSGRDTPRTIEAVAHHVTWTRYPDRIEVECTCGEFSPVLEHDYSDEQLRRLGDMHGREEAAPPSWVVAALAACSVGPTASRYEELILTAIHAAERGIRADERQLCAVRLRLRANKLDRLPDNGTFRGGLRAAADLIGEAS